jgi:hypothetical protein
MGNKLEKLFFRYLRSVRIKFINILFNLANENLEKLISHKRNDSILLP